MLDRDIVLFCAPTLAGLKTGSVFSVGYESAEELRVQLRDVNRRLRPKGLRVLPLRMNGKRALIYVFRPGKLAGDLAGSEAGEILERCGYCSGNCAECLARLGKRLRERGDFPHEIGLFLGYPAEDVRGFMDNESPKFSGEWKVYGDVDAARETFARHKKCTRLYCQQCERGKAMERLAVAG